MKKRSLIVAAVVVCVCILALGLVGCSGGSSSSAGGSTSAAINQGKEALAGTWDLCGITESDGTVTSAEDIQVLKEHGLEVYLELNADGSGTIVLFGEPLKASWEAQGASSGVLTARDEVMNMTLADGKLSLEQNNMTLEFEKGNPRSGGSASATASAASAGTAASASASSTDASESSAEASE